MPDITTDFTALRCSQCGGEVNVETSNLVKTAEGDFMYIGAEITADKAYKCSRCKTEFIPKFRERYAPASIVVNQTIGVVEKGASVIGAIIRF